MILPGVIAVAALVGSSAPALQLQGLLMRCALVALFCALPPLLISSVCAAITELLLRRAGITRSGLPELVRLSTGAVAVLLCAAWIGSQIATVATGMWAALPAAAQ